MERETAVIDVVRRHGRFASGVESSPHKPPNDLLQGYDISAYTSFRGQTSSCLLPIMS